MAGKKSFSPKNLPGDERVKGLVAKARGPAKARAASNAAKRANPGASMRKASAAMTRIKRP